MTLEHKKDLKHPKTKPQTYGKTFGTESPVNPRKEAATPLMPALGLAGNSPFNSSHRNGNVPRNNSHQSYLSSDTWARVSCEPQEAHGGVCHRGKHFRTGISNGVCDPEPLGSRGTASKGVGLVGAQEPGMSGVESCESNKLLTRSRCLVFGDSAPTVLLRRHQSRRQV